VTIGVTNGFKKYIKFTPGLGFIQGGESLEFRIAFLPKKGIPLIEGKVKIPVSVKVKDQVTDTLKFRNII